MPTLFDTCTIVRTENAFVMDPEPYNDDTAAIHAPQRNKDLRAIESVVENGFFTHTHIAPQVRAYPIAAAIEAGVTCEILMGCGADETAYARELCDRVFPKHAPTCTFTLPWTCGGEPVCDFHAIYDQMPEHFSVLGNPVR